MRPMVLDSIMPARQAIDVDIAALDVPARVAKFIDDAFHLMTATDEDGTPSVIDLRAIAWIDARLLLRRITAEQVRFEVRLEMRGRHPRKGKEPLRPNEPTFDFMPQAKPAIR